MLHEQYTGFRHLKIIEFIILERHWFWIILQVWVLFYEFSAAGNFFYELSEAGVLFYEFPEARVLFYEFSAAGELLCLQAGVFLIQLYSQQRIGGKIKIVHYIDKINVVRCF